MFLVWLADWQALKPKTRQQHRRRVSGFFNMSFSLCRDRVYQIIFDYLSPPNISYIQINFLVG
jgi:hypothetical protein